MSSSSSSSSSSQNSKSKSKGKSKKGSSDQGVENTSVCKKNVDWPPQPKKPESKFPHHVGNFDQFIDSISPIVNARYFYKRNTTGWKEPDMCSYFVLGDLWKSFSEWSAYGVGVPLDMNGDKIVQYYVPYLSGLQLFTKPITLNPTRVSSDNKARLVFQFIEERPPYTRETLTDKIFKLAPDCPDLLTLESCDLHTSSWISVAWYPIYRIPMKNTFQTIKTSFLSFYSLATISKVMMANPNLADGTLSYKEVSTKSKKKLKVPAKTTISLVGMATLRYQKSIWDQSDDTDVLAENDPSILMEEATELVRRSNVVHSDFKFFSRHNSRPHLGN